MSIYLTQREFVKSIILKLFLRHLKDLTPLCSSNILQEIEDNNLSYENWRNCEKLIAASFLTSSKKKMNLFSRNSGLFGDQLRSVDFAHNVRRKLAEVYVDESPIQLPERADLELQVRRALYWMRLWKRAARKCVLEDVLSADEFIQARNIGKYGYTSDGGIVFELEREREIRMKLLAEPVVRTCKCRRKDGCRTRQCGCIRRNLSCIFCECSSGCGAIRESS